MSLLLAACAAAAFGSADFLAGLTARRIAPLTVVAWSEAVGLVVALVAAAPFRSAGPTGADVVWSVAAGWAGAVGMVFLFRGLATGRMAVVAPLSAVVGAVVPVAVGLALGERPSVSAWAGVALAAPAIALVSSPGKGAGTGPGRAWLGVASGVAFGMFFVFITRTTPTSGLWPLAILRAASLIFVAAIARLRGASMGAPGRVRPALVAVGVGDMGANILFLLGARSGLLSLVAVVAGLYPAFTVLLARLVLGERIRRLQVIGLVLALAVVALIAG